MKLQKRLESSYSAEAKKYIKLLSIGDSRIVGSYLYKVAKYPADIDIYSEVVKCCGLDEAVKKIAKDIQKIVRKLEAPDSYLSDFKAGVDNVYSVDIGKLEYKGKDSRIVGFNYVKVFKELEKLTDDGYLTKREFNEMFYCMNGVKDGDVKEFVNLGLLLKEKRVQRWNRKEILQGYKILIKDRKMTLENALKMQSLVKIDIFAWINGRYQEASNFMILFYKESKNGKPIKINKLQPDFLDAVRIDIEKMWSCIYWDPMKALKRMWVIARIEGDNKVVRNINPLLEGDAALVKQTIDDMDVLVDLLSGKYKLDMKRIKDEISRMKSKLGYVEDFNVDDIRLDKGLDKAHKLTNKKEIAEILKEIKGDLKGELNDYVFDYAKLNTLYPPSKLYLPGFKKYSGGCDGCEVECKCELECKCGGCLDCIIKEVIGGFDWGYPLKKSYQVAANAYRGKACGLDGKTSHPRSRKLKYGEIHPLCANFMGPGTRIDLKSVRDTKPYNKSDACAKQHDLDYLASDKLKGKEKAKAIRKADDKIIDCIKKTGENNIYSKLGLAGIESKMKMEDLIPMLMKKIAPDYFGGYYGERTEIQSILMPRKMGLKKAINWVRKEGYVVKKIDKTDKYFRFRQKEPKYKKYRTIDFGKGIKAVLGIGKK